MVFDNTAPLGIAFLGLLLGMRHATDPDHVIAVTTILSRERRFAAAARIGIVWGLGHTLTVLATGAAIITLKLEIPIRLGLAMEFAVAIVLILLGTGSATNLLRMMIAPNQSASNPSTPDSSGRPTNEESNDLHSHPDTHHDGGAFHRHTYAHHGGAADGHDSSALDHNHRLPKSLMAGVTARRPLLKSFGVGLVHGLAGSAAIALVVLSAIPQPIWATIYLAIFCVGTIIGMALITTAIGAPFMLASRRMTRLHQTLVMGSGLLSVGFGFFLAWHIGITDHLFGIAPIWTPH